MRMCAINDPCPFTGVNEKERARVRAQERERMRERESVCVCVCLYVRDGVEGCR